MAEVEAIAQTNIISSTARITCAVTFANGIFSITTSLGSAPTAIPYGTLVSLACPVNSYPLICPYSTVTPGRFYACANHGSGDIIGYFGGNMEYLQGRSGGAGTVPTPVNYLCIYQDRLVASDGINFYMSRASNHIDWDYSNTDAGAAIAGNTLNGANLGDNIIAMVPFVNDALVLFASQSIYIVRGNLKAGGSIDLVSRNVGILGARAWTYDPAGNIYFADTTGFYRMTPGGQLENLSRDLVNSYFENTERASSRVQLCWDERHKGCWIFFTLVASSASVHLWYDSRTGGFFPQQLPTAHGPLSSCMFDGNTLADRCLLLGGRDGTVRKFDDASANDDGTAITSYVYIGPFEPGGPGREAKCIAIDAILGETPFPFDDGNWNCEPTLLVGISPYNAMTDPEQTKAFNPWTASLRQNPQACRMGGNTFWLKLYNNSDGKLFIVDRIIGRFLAAGKEDGAYV